MFHISHLTKARRDKSSIDRRRSVRAESFYDSVSKRQIASSINAGKKVSNRNSFLSSYRPTSLTS